MTFCSRRRFLYVVNLETPSEAPRKIGRQSKWDVGTVQWNPHKTESHVFAASVSPNTKSNQTQKNDALFRSDIYLRIVDGHMVAP